MLNSGREFAATRQELTDMLKTAVASMLATTTVTIDPALHPLSNDRTFGAYHLFKRLDGHVAANLLLISN